jgi:hypothetical protein
MTTEKLYRKANAVQDEIEERLRKCDWYHDLKRQYDDLMQQWLLQWTAEEKAGRLKPSNLKPSKRRRAARNR